MIQGYINSLYNLVETTVSNLTTQQANIEHDHGFNNEPIRSPSKGVGRGDWEIATPTLSENQLDDKEYTESDSDDVTLLSGSTETDFANLLSDTLTNSSPNSDTPIFFVDGFMSFQVVDIWVNIITHFRQRAFQSGVACPPLHRLHSGGVASAHDMAVSLFYQIKGGTEDFGEEHANIHGHDRYGLHHNGVYKGWSSEYPVHMLAHSHGGNVAMHLQRLLEAKFFHDENGIPYDTHAGWILTAALVSSPLRGTTCALILGLVPGQPGKIKPRSLGSMLYFVAQIWEWLEWHDPREGWLGINFRMSHFGLGRDRSIRSLISRLFGAELFDKGLDSSAEGFFLEKYFQDPYKSFDSTYYRTYATSMTRTSVTGEERNIPHWLPIIRVTSNIMGKFDLKKDGQGYLDSLIEFQSLWRKNDGVCPLISQFHPENCDQLKCHHSTLPPPNKFLSQALPPQLQPGTWYCSTIPDCSHIDLVPGFNLHHQSDPFRLPRKIINGLLHPFTSSPFTKFDDDEERDEITNSVRHYRNTFMDDYLQFLVQVETNRS